MWTISARAISSLKSSSRFKISVKPARTFTGDTGTEEFVFLGGSLSNDRNQQVPWTGTIDVSNRLTDGRNALPYLDPRAGRTIQVVWNILFADNAVENVNYPPMIVTELKPSPGKFTLTLTDYSTFFKDDRTGHSGTGWGGPLLDEDALTDVPANLLYAITVQRSFTGTTIPLPTLTDATGIVTTYKIFPRVPDSTLVLDQADNVADTFGLQYGVWRNKNFLVRKKKVPGVDAESWAFVSGVNGVILEPINYTIQRADYYNAVVAHSTDNPAATGTAIQGSGPLRTNGDFGNRGRLYASPLITTGLQGASAATKILATATSDRWALSISSMPTPHLDAGDIISVQLEGIGIVQRTIASITHPLTVGESTVITTDAPPLPDEQAIT